MVQTIDKKKLVFGILLLVVAYFVGRFTGPTKVETREVEKVVYRERVKKEEDRHASSNTREVRLPDGTIIKETTRTVDRSTRTDTSTSIDSTRESETKTENRPNWRLGLIYKPMIANHQEQKYGLTLEHRLFSELYIGVHADTDKTIGASISIGF